MVASASDSDRDRLISQLQAITIQLRKVKPNTTAYTEAPQLLVNAEQKLTALQGN